VRTKLVYDRHYIRHFCAVYDLLLIAHTGLKIFAVYPREHGADVDAPGQQ